MATIRNTLETNFTTRGATRAVRETEQIGRAQTRLGQGSASAGRSFAAQSQGLGGLVGIYAAAAANVFAISAAFQALNASAQFETIIRGTESLANAVGTSANAVIGSLKDITAGQLSIVEAARNANLALSAGFNIDQIEQLGSVALKASRALGRDLSDSFQRLTRGAIKLEPELLDELGIFTRIEPAVNAYALSVGKSVSQLTQFERRQAFANQVIKDGNDAFKDIDTSVISTQETFEKLVANFSDLAIIVGSFIADSLVPLAEFLDKNLGNRILLLGSIGLIVFNGLRVALVGLATTGIGALSASLAGLSANFSSTRATAGELANEAADVADQFKGQGAFVGGNASEGAALKKSLAEGGVSTREAIRLKERIPELTLEEESYQRRLNQRYDAGNISLEARDRLAAQSVARANALASTETLVNRQLATAGPLAQNMARGLNAAAVAASLLGKALSIGLKLLNAIGIIFVVLQGIGSIIGVDVFGKAREFYEYLFDASAAFKTGQEALTKVFDDQAQSIRDLALEQQKAGVENDGKTPKVDTDTIDALQKKIDNVTAKISGLQKGIPDAAASSPAFLAAEAGLAAAEAAALPAKNLQSQVDAAQATIQQLKQEQGAVGFSQKNTNFFGIETNVRSPAEKQRVEELTASITAQEAAIDSLKDKLKEQKDKVVELDRATAEFAFQQDVVTAAQSALEMSFDNTEKARAELTAGLEELQKELESLTGTKDATVQLRSLVEVSGALANSLKTANPLLNSMFNAKIIGNAEDIANGFGRLQVTINGVTKDIALLNKEGFITKEQEQSVQDLSVGADMLRKLMINLRKGTISNTEATKKMAAITKNLNEEIYGGASANFGGNPLGIALKEARDIAQEVVNEFNNMSALADTLKKKFKGAFATIENVFIDGKISAETGEIATNAEEEAKFQAQAFTLLEKKRKSLLGQVEHTGTIQQIEEAQLAIAKQSYATHLKLVSTLTKDVLAQEKKLQTMKDQVKAIERQNALAQIGFDAADSNRKREATLRQGGTIEGGASLGAQPTGQTYTNFAGDPIMGDTTIRQNTVGSNAIAEATERLTIEKAATAEVNKQITFMKQAADARRANNQLSRSIEGSKASAGAAGAQAAASLKVAQYEGVVAKIQRENILTERENIQLLIGLEKVKEKEALKALGAQAGAAKKQAELDKEAVSDKIDAAFEARMIEIETIAERKKLFKEEEAVKKLELDQKRAEIASSILALEEERKNIDKRLEIQIAIEDAAKATRDAEIDLLEKKYKLLDAQIKYGKQNIADQKKLIEAEIYAKRGEVTDIALPSALQDPTQSAEELVKKLLKGFGDLRLESSNIRNAKVAGLDAGAADKRGDVNSRMSATNDELANINRLGQERAALYQLQLSGFDQEMDATNQIYTAKIMGFQLEKEQIKENLNATLAGLGAEGEAIKEAAKQRIDALNNEISAAKKFKDLVVGITGSINEGLSNAIQKLFENAATRGASLTDGIKEIGLGMYEDIRKTIVDQTIVTPAQDMMKGFIGNLTGLDLDKKGIDEVILKDGKVPVTMGGGEEDPITKVKKDIEEKGESFFTGFKEKAKGAFDSIQTSLGDFGSKAMETFKGLGSGIKNLFTGENGILSGLGGMFKGLMGSEGGGGLFSSITGMLGMGAGGGGFNFGSLFGMAAGAPMATGGLVGVRSMAAGGQVNALRDRVPTMLEPGEFVMRKPAVKSIGAGNLGKMNATGAGGIGNVQFNIVNQGEPKEAEEQGQPKFEADKIVIDVVMKDLASNGPIRQAMRNG